MKTGLLLLTLIVGSCVGVQCCLEKSSMRCYGCDKWLFTEDTYQATNAFGELLGYWCESCALKMVPEQVERQRAAKNAAENTPR